MSNDPRRFRGGKILRTSLAAILVTGLGAAVIWGFLEGRTEAAREAERERPVAAPLRVSTENNAPVITLNAATEAASGIATAPPVSASYQSQVRAYGTVLDLARLTDLGNSYLSAKAQLASVQAKLAASKAAFDRAQKLNRDQQNVSAAQLQTAEAAFRGDQATLAAADAQARTVQATLDQEWGPVLGKSLVEGSPLMTRLIERQDFLVQVTLPPGVVVPPPPTAHVQINTGQRADIRFISPATRTDPKIQGVSFFYLAAGDSGVLPGMNVLAFLPSGASVQGETIPGSAVVWWQDRAWAYSRIAPNKFTRFEVATDLPAPDGGYVAKNLPSGTQVVTNGAQLLLSEEFRAQIQVGVDQK